MTEPEIKTTAQSIAKAFVESKKDMNEAIKAFADKKRLNDEQVKRLVEECNNSAFLLGFQKSGEQIFDVADFSKIRGEIEKKASCSIEVPCFSYGLEPMAKVAEAPTEEEGAKEIGQLRKLAEEYRVLNFETSKLEGEFFRLCGAPSVMLKCASVNRPAQHSEYVEKKARMEEIKKEASLLWGSMKPTSVGGLLNLAIGGPLRAVAGVGTAAAHGAANLAARGVAATAPAVVGALAGTQGGVAALGNIASRTATIGGVVAGAKNVAKAVTKPTTFVANM